MTDRHAGYIVVLDEDIREDDAAVVIQAISMIKGVSNVEPIVSDAKIQLARSRERTTLAEQLSDFAIGLLRVGP